MYDGYVTTAVYSSFEGIRPRQQEHALVHPDPLPHFYDVVLCDPSSGELGRVARFLQYRRDVVFVDLHITTSAGTGTDNTKQ